MQRTCLGKNEAGSLHYFTYYNVLYIECKVMQRTCLGKNEAGSFLSSERDILP